MSTAATHAKGLEGVVAAETRLSDVRGEEGVLVYAGYNINELAGKITFEEVVHLLHENRLPNRQELDSLKRTLSSYRALPPKVIEILRMLASESWPQHPGAHGRRRRDARKTDVSPPYEPAAGSPASALA